ncbi:MAG: HYR domain-containing protein, partial [Mariprofundales bacterium]
MQYILFICLFILSACGGGGNGQNANTAASGQTQVSISLGTVLAAGAVGQGGQIPNTVQSMSVTAYSSTGLVIAGPAIANAPTLSVTLNVPNGLGIRFVILAFDTQGATGNELHRGEVTADLTGGTVALPVKMNLSVSIIPSQIQSIRGQTLTFTGAVSGNAPPASSPLLWTTTGGTTPSLLDVYGGTATWTAPNSLGTFTLTAKVDPSVNPDQDATFVGTSIITVINQAPIANADSASTGATGTANIDVLANDTDPENDILSIASITQATKGITSINATGITYTANAGAAGNDSFTYILQDSFGAQSPAATVSMTLNDTQAPVFNNVPANLTIEASSSTGIAASNNLIQTFFNSTAATDNVAVLSLTNNALTTFPLGTTTITWTATDAAGNFVTASANIVVQDTTTPIITVPANITVTAIDAYGTPAIDPYITAFLNGAVAMDIVSGILPASPYNAPNTFSMGATVVTFISTDTYANVALATATITIQNKSAPVVIAPANIVAAAIDATGTPVNTAVITSFIAAATATDLLGNVLAVNNNALIQFPLGITTVTFTAIDSYGNKGSATSTVTVSDQTAPTIVTPTDRYVEATSQLTIAALGTAVVTDNVDIGLLAAPNTQGPFPLGITTIIWSATDGYGNLTVANQLIHISDTTPPTLSIPADIYSEAASTQSTINLGTATAQDLVSITPIVTNNAPATFPVGITQVLWVAVDSYANTATAIQNIFISDTTSPTIIAPADVYAEALGVLTTVVIGTATAIDTVDAAPVITSNTPATFPVGTTVIIWTATDIYGNASTAIQNIVVGDTVAPTITAPADVYAEASGLQTTVVIGTATAID